MALTAYTKTVYLNGQAPARNDTNLNNTEDGVEAVTDEAMLHASRLDDLEAPVSTLYAPQATPPAYVEGQQYYDSVNDTMVIQSKYSDAPIRPGHTMHAHVINNSGAVIEKGMACRHNGVDAGGILQIEKAIATSFTNARIYGVAQHDIANLAEGAVITFGEIYDVDTSGVAAGVPLYLSDTVAGTWSATAPDIVSRVGGAKTSAASGVLSVNMISNTSLPTVFGGVKTLTTPAVAVTTTAQDLAVFTTTKSVVVGVNATTGELTLPNQGEYRASLSASIAFSSVTNTRSITFELYDVTNTAILYSYVKNIPRDSIEDGVSFSFPISSLADDVVKMRIKSSTAITVTFTNITFDVQSINIR